MIERYSFRDRKISYRDLDDLNRQLAEIDGEVLSIRPCTPDATDTNQWCSVYYKYSI